MNVALPGLPVPAVIACVSDGWIPVTGSVPTKQATLIGKPALKPLGPPLTVFVATSSPNASVTVLVAVAVQGGALSPGEQSPLGGEADAVLAIVAGGFAPTVALIV